MQIISRIVPLTPGVEIIRALVEGNFYPGLLLSLGHIILVTVVFFSVSLYSMRRRVID